MDPKIIEPVNIESLNIMESLLEVNGAPADKMRVDLSVSMPEASLSLDESGNSYSLAPDLTVRVNLVDENDSNDIRMKASVRVVAQISTPVSVHDGSKAALAFLEVQGMSSCYAHAKAHIASLTAMSPVGLFTLPEFNAAEYVQALHAQRETLSK